MGVPKQANAKDRIRKVPTVVVMDLNTDLKDLEDGLEENEQTKTFSIPAKLVSLEYEV